VPKVTNRSIVAATVPGPWGPIHVATSARGVVAIDVLAPPEQFAAELERRFGTQPRFVATPAAPAPATRKGPTELAHLRRGLAAVEAFLGGDATAFDDLALDLSDRPAWDRTVLGAVRSIPWGGTESYGSVAAAIGRRGAARAVGGAVGRNPISLAIPCHRVIAGDGGLGGFGGGWWGSRELRLDLKRDLLAREGSFVADHPHIADRASVAHATPRPGRRR
jgi:O-6-methylguanine DNA methyltransferase